MILSHKHRFIFVAIGKTGTTSIESYLRTLPIVKNRAPKHFSLQEIINSYENVCDYLKFAFARNPFDRAVSMYFQWKKPHSEYKDKYGTRKMLFDLANKYSFKKFIANTGAFHFNGHHMVEKINYEIDFIGRFEKLQEDFNQACDIIGISRCKLPHLNKTTRKHYTEYYDDEARQIVAEIFTKDLEVVGYEYGE